MENTLKEFQIFLRVNLASNLQLRGTACNEMLCLAETV